MLDSWGHCGGTHDEAIVRRDRGVVGGVGRSKRDCQLQRSGRRNITRGRTVDKDTGHVRGGIQLGCAEAVPWLMGASGAQVVTGVA